MDLGLTVDGDGLVPCYGTGKLAGPTNPKCRLIRSPSSPTPASILVYDFPSTLSGDTLSLHIPRIFNPYCAAIVTDDIPCLTSSHLQINIIEEIGRM